ncbi:hypothetical protein JW988_05385 [Candidatus Bathyarchaeota archaeon]|nr:hypothetical protein [Candidatus Bathyarchaeota archaeon]
MNEATLDFTGQTFTSSILNLGYEAWYSGTWNGTHWENQGYWSGCMRLFGDGNLHVNQPRLTVSASSGGYATPSGTHRYTYGHNAVVVATAYDHYDFYEWKLDGNHYSYNYITSIVVNDNHNLQAFFNYDPPPPPEHDLTVLCYDQYNNPGYVSLYIDTQYVGLTMDTYSVTEGQRVLEVPSQVGNHYFYAWYYDGNYHYNNPTTVSVYSDKTVTACYLYYP